MIIAYLRNELSPADKAGVEKWVRTEPENERYLNKVKFIWERSGSDFQGIVTDHNAAWEKIQSAITRDRLIRIHPSYFTLPAIRRIAAIAIILLSIGFITTLVIRQEHVSEMEWISQRSDTEKADIILPDGSHVWLNRDSEIIFPAKFKRKSREIRFTGEAFFTVAENRRKPFFIHSRGSAIEVLGTTFNVESNSSSSVVTVTVVSGQVALFDSINRENRIILQPGDRGIYDSSTGELIKKKNDDVNFLAWKTGVLIFENTPLDEVCEILSEHFRRSVTVDNDEILEEKNLTGTYDNKDFKEIIKILEITLDLSGKTENDTITLFTN